MDRARQELAAANERLEDLHEDDTIEIKIARDEAHEAARTGVVTLNTLDYRRVDASLSEWERVTTGALHDEVVSSRAQSRQALVNAKSVTKATVMSSAVKDVDERAGSATVLVALRINVSTGDIVPTDKYMRIQSTVRRTDQGWKLDSIGQVPYSQ